jgi:predicted phage terminase large subunit-like protein
MRQALTAQTTRRPSTRPLASCGLYDFIPRVSPRYQAPRHLDPLVVELERAWREPVKRTAHAPPRFAKCQPAGSLVLLADGSRVPIEKVEPGSVVATLNNDYIFGVANVVAAEPNGVRPTLRITLYSGRMIECTENHPLLTVLGWRRADALRVGDSVATARRLPCPDSPSMPTGFAALMGYLVGDGSFGTGDTRLTIADADVLADVRRIADAHGWVLWKDPHGDYEYHVRRAVKTGPRGSSAREQMRAWGLKPGTSRTKRVPACIFRANRDDLAAFVGAYFNCDGTVNPKTGIASITSVNRALVADVQDLLTRFGIFATVRRRMGKYKGEPHESWALTIMGGELVSFADQIPVVGAKGERLREVANGLRNRRHFPQHESIPPGWQALLKRTLWWHRKNSGIRADKNYTHGAARSVVLALAEAEDNDELRKLCSDDIAWERIEKIERVGSVPTFGISVEGTKNYVSEGVVSHNTDTVLAFAALTLLKQPHRTVGYVTYEAHTAYSKSRKARAFALAGGVELAADAKRMGEWRTPQGGGLIATGVGGPLTSQGVDVLLVDDPYKNRMQAESAAYREHLVDWWNDVAETRIEPGGSAFIFHTRWHTDDLTGHVLGGEDAESWRHLRMPALSDEGESLWPERWSVEALEQKRRAVGEYTWASLYQGVPRARGGAVFGDVHFYEDRPADGYRVAIGVDLAYTKKTHADYSVAVVLAEKAGKFYVLDVRRVQVQAPAFGGVLSSVVAGYPRARMIAYVSGTERGVVDFLRASDVPLEPRAAQADKFVRAQPVAAAWNAGDVLVPRFAPWADDFVAELAAFTGVDDAHDDQVDALAAAFDALAAEAATTFQVIRMPRTR